jgi:adenylate kinase family enzyme
MKIHLFGASGSGVSTLGKQLEQTLEVPFLDTDTYFWEESAIPFTVRRDPPLRNAMLKADVARQSRWIIGGSLVSWGDEWLSAFDLAVFLWIPNELRMQRLKAREYERYGDVIFTDARRHEKYNAFMEWAAGYEDASFQGRSLHIHEAWMAKLTCPVLELRGDMTVAEREKKVVEKIRLLPCGVEENKTALLPGKG